MWEKIGAEVRHTRNATRVQNMKISNVVKKIWVSREPWVMFKV